MTDIKTIIDDNKTEEIANWKESNVLNENVVEYKFHDDNITSLCSPLFYAIKESRVAIAIKLMELGANPLKEEKITLSSDAYCLISHDSLEGKTVTRLTYGRLEADKVFETSLLMEWVNSKSEDPFTKEALSLLKISLQPYKLNPMILACRMGLIEVLKAMSLKEDKHKECLTYGFLYDEADVIKWALEKVEEDTTWIKDNLDLVSDWTEITNNIDCLGVKLYGFFITSQNLKAINALLEKNVAVDDDMVERIIELVPYDLNIPKNSIMESRLRGLLESEHDAIFEMMLEHKEIRFEPLEGQVDYYFLFQAIKHEKPNHLALLLQHGADVDHKGGFPLPPIFHAINHNQKDCVEKLLEYGAELNQDSFERGGLNVYTAAMMLDRYDIFNLLIEHTQELEQINISRDSIYNPLVYALCKKRIEWAKAILSFFNSQSRYAFRLYEEPELVEEYIEDNTKSNPIFSDKMHMSRKFENEVFQYMPIHLLIHYGAKELVNDMVKEDPCCINYTTIDNHTAWQLALKLGQDEIAKELVTKLDKTKTVEVGGEKKATLLDYVLENYISMGSTVRSLIESGVGVSEKFDQAKELNCKKVKRAIKSWGNKLKCDIVKRLGSLDAIVTPMLSEELTKKLCEQNIYALPCKYSNKEATRIVNIDSEIVKEAIQYYV